MSSKAPVPGRKAARLNPPPAQRRHFLRRFWMPAVIMLALAAGGLTGIVAAYQLNYSSVANEVASLATYRPSEVTRVYADDGETVIGEFALEKRIPLKYEEIPPVLRNAILAIEDARFNDHVGIDPIRIVGAVIKNITTGSHEGGSTLTQQLAKNLFLSKEQTLKRKMTEWAMALEIERYYTKNQIMELYVNHIFLGAGAYGFEAASETYFGKPAKDLTLEEAALLAGIPKAPGEYSPTIHPQAAKDRRDLVLDQMAKNNFTTQGEVEAAKARPIKLAETAFYQSQERSSPFAYPVEEIRQYLEDKYTTRVAQSGLKVYTTINPDSQKKAVEVVRAGLRRYDRSHGGWRSTYVNIAATVNSGPINNTASSASAVTATPAVTQQQLESYKHPDWYGNDYKVGTHITGLIMKVDGAKNEATARFGSFTATVTAKDMGWGNRSPKTEFKTGDLAEFEIKGVDEKSNRLQVELSQIPAVQGAMMTINAKTGEIIEEVGGYDFYTNKFNNATQAYRQTGSCFKPFIYTAAIEWGMTPDTTVSGAPIKIGNWSPHNYDGSTSNGDLPLKTALAKSMNIPAVHLLQTVGIQTGAQMVRRFGITAPMAPYLPSALGATEVPLDQMVSAYSALPNKGVRVEKHLIRRVLDRDDNVLEEWEPTTFKVTSEYVALTMVQLMKGVVDNGTATGAKVLGVPLAGKTGTVNDHTDVWFIGYTPTYVTGVWMGYPGRKKPLGNDMTGGHGALPFFVDFMKDFLKGKPKENFDKAPQMPEDMKELIKQRQREMSEEKLDFVAQRASFKHKGDDAALPAIITDPKLEQVTLPPGPKTDEQPAGPGSQNSGTAPRKIEPNAIPHTDTLPAPPAAPVTRPREVETQKKKGKKGEGEP
ncbi:MAG TPA: PBP1A family penicillin-binding protein [Pyrinomonadaceae bacterium]|jgi:penicillin-binding protein 1A|nr:PBP1A family penicillin-binding protein [Pyrinomonadaceae bacterium]